MRRENVDARHKAGHDGLYGRDRFLTWFRKAAPAAIARSEKLFAGPANQCYKVIIAELDVRPPGKSPRRAFSFRREHVISKTTELRVLARRHTRTAIAALLGLITSKTTSDTIRHAAANSLLDRAWGKPTQMIAGDDGAPLVRITEIVTNIVDPKPRDEAPTLIGEALAPVMPELSGIATAPEPAAEAGDEIDGAVER
jgi:hypothetical protein